MSPATFDVRSVVLDGEIHAFTVRGELDMHTAPELEEELAEALEKPNAAIMLDLSECEFIDSTGIALIVRAWQRVCGENGQASGGGRLVLCCINRQVRRLLEITGVEGTISVHEQRDTALAELRG